MCKHSLQRFGHHKEWLIETRNKIRQIGVYHAFPWSWFHLFVPFQEKCIVAPDFSVGCVSIQWYLARRRLPCNISCGGFRITAAWNDRHCNLHTDFRKFLWVFFWGEWQLLSVFASEGTKNPRSLLPTFRKMKKPWGHHLKSCAESDVPNSESVAYKLPGWWFQVFSIFTTFWGDDPIWRAYFSDGLKPPTSYF